MPKAAKKNPQRSIADATPMMKQYLAIKQDHTEYLLFYRMGDFYELFFEDAVIAAKTLDIALTKRGQHGGEDIPMCGVPHHSSEQYLQKLIKSGFKVAVCEQMESPEVAKKRGAKSVVKREVVRIITPGTLTEDSLLESTLSNYLVAITKAQNQIAIAWLDISTGIFEVTTLEKEASIISELSRLSPKEILLADKWLDDRSFMHQLEEWKTSLTTHVNSFFESTRAERTLQEFYDIKTTEALGFKNRAEVSACGSLIEYLELTQKETLPRLPYPQHFETTSHMQMDNATRRNLEISCTTSGEYRGSLLSIIDRTSSNVGARLLRQHLATPLLDIDAINARLTLVDYFYKHSDVRRSIRTYLSLIPDMERGLSRLYMGRGGPRDLAVIKIGLLGVLNILGTFESCNNEQMPEQLKQIIKQMAPHEPLIQLLSEALKEEVPMLAREGGFIRSGYNATLDEYREAKFKGSQLKQELRDKYSQKTGIERLKVGENNLIGLYIEVATQHINKMPDDFVHRQTLANAVRYSTPELKELENKIVNASHASLVLELEIFDHLLEEVLAHSDSIALSTNMLAALDVSSSHAQLAEERNYCRPQLNNGRDIQVEKGRHPVVEAFIETDFIQNNCVLKEGQDLWLLTGPNMAGKSTFLRQNALIIVMAQIGSYVPAKKAEIGVVDRVFSRVGASDDLARGQSTFMVEMVETAIILNQSTKRSFVILDEIGRGTATFDGLSIAWAVVEYLHDVNNCRAIFATHYHELTALTSKLKDLMCYTMKVKEWNDNVVFMHEVIAGTADRSYGIHVGKLAGLPKEVTKRAEQILITLQEDNGKNAASKLSDDLPLFAATKSQETMNTYASEIEARIADAEVDSLSPRQALELIYELKEMTDGK